MVMDNYYNPDRLQEIWHQIIQLHMSYLALEESTEKLEQRSKLENFIKEYLCLTPHNQKFYFQETSEVLHRSANNKKDFSGYKAAVGWNAIGMYAGNLLGQPWRREYRQIKTYSGFYKHQIEANLVGAEIMFEAMGYKHLGNGVMVLEDPICIDRVTYVSLDSLIAYVECQVLKTIWEEVGNSFEISWLDVLQFRESHLCTPKQSVNALIYRLNERQYHELNNRQASQQQHGTDYYNTSPRYPTQNHSFPPHAHAQNHYITQQIQNAPPHCMHTQNNPYCNTYNPYSRYNMPYPVPVPYAAPVVKPQYHTNGYYYPNNGFVPPRVVPTGQLIELEQNGMYDVPDSAVRPVRAVGSSHHQIANVKAAPAQVIEREEGSGTFESWDYVYRNLESQGYNKDLGERGDILSPPLDRRNPRHFIREAKKVRATDIDEAMHGLMLNNEANCTPPPYGGAKDSAIKVATKDAQSSSYENVSSPESYVKRNQPALAPAQKTAASRSKTLQRNAQAAPAPISASVDSSSRSMTLDARKNRKSNAAAIDATPSNPIVESQKPAVAAKPTTSAAASKVKTAADKWECNFCTYINSAITEICEMCGKSKTVVAQNLEIGGSQCPACTLVNPKEAATCQACTTSLKNSPTYI